MYFCFHLVVVILDLLPLTKTIESFISVFYIRTSDILIGISLSVLVELGKPASFEFSIYEHRIFSIVTSLFVSSEFSRCPWRDTICILLYLYLLHFGREHHIDSIVFSF